MKFIKKFIGMIEFINHHLGRYLGWVILMISILIGYDTIMRYFFKSPNEWVQEAALYGFGIFALLGSGYVQWCKSHIRTDVFSARLSPRAQNFLNIFYFIPAAVFVIALLVAGWDIFSMAVTQNQRRTGTLAWPLWPYLLAIPLGAILVLFQLVIDLVKNTIEAFDKKQKV
jgi:TRAP-type C4-dicarboxylate transport system permease small subunit